MNRPTRMLLLAGVSFAIFLVAMHVPLEYIPIDTRYDKLYHCLFFAILTVMLMLGIRRHWSIALLLSVVIASFSEVSQLISPIRSASLADWYSDLTGITLATMLFLITRWLYGKWKNRR